MSEQTQERVGHTPGPWTIVEDERYPKGPIVCQAPDGLIGRVEVAHCQQGRMADARLIKAAPKLLGLAKTARSLLSGLHMKLDDYPLRDSAQLPTTIRELNEVIAEVEDTP